MGAVISIVAILGFVGLLLSPIIIGGKYAETVAGLGTMGYWEHRTRPDGVEYTVWHPGNNN